MSIRLPLIAGTALLALVGSIPKIACADTISFTVGQYSSPGYDQFSGFRVQGNMSSIVLTPGVSSSVRLDLISEYFPSSSPQTATAVSNLTVDGSTQSISDAFNFDSARSPAIEFTGGLPVVFDFGSFDVTVTATASNTDRQATFLETSAASPVPEPARLALLGPGLLGLGFAIGHRRKSGQALDSTHRSDVDEIAEQRSLPAKLTDAIETSTVP